ncbi:MAG TPA: hypothetical protein VK427_07070 [Kofleriaceae bacterium]|nr:hypothetical protein [Kofleriaceae bacterium]
MDDRTWLLYMKAACSRDQRVRGQVIAQDSYGGRSEAFERLELEGDCSCHPPSTTAAQDTTQTA